MKADGYWQLFLDTGAPEMYLLYNQARKEEEANVFKNSGACPQSNSLQ